MGIKKFAGNRGGNTKRSSGLFKVSVKGGVHSGEKNYRLKRICTDVGSGEGAFWKPKKAGRQYPDHETNQSRKSVSASLKPTPQNGAFRYRRTMLDILPKRNQQKNQTWDKGERGTNPFGFGPLSGYLFFSRRVEVVFWVSEFDADGYVRRERERGKGKRGGREGELLERRREERIEGTRG